MVKKLIILFFLIICLNQLNALNSNVVHCISVNSNGSITLNWAKPTDVTGFKSYNIFRANTSSGPFVLIDSIFNINQLVYTDNGVNANLQSYFYYIKCKSTSNVLTASSDTLQSILLTVTNLGTGLANLNWNPIRIPLLPTSLGKYLIFRKNGSAFPWAKIDSTNLLYYVDTVNVCSDTVYYRIEIGDNTGCKSVSSVDKEYFKDITAPLTFGLDTVSVDVLTGRVRIGWRPSPSNDVKGYVICHGSPCLVVDTIWGRFNTTYLDSLFDPCNASQGYRIAVFDSCFNTSLFSNNHNTIFLTSNYYKCDNKIVLNWTPYINMNPAISGYKVMMSKNGGVYSEKAILPSSTLNYTADNLTDSTTYCFYIQAYETTSGKTSSSCIKCYHIIKSLNPETLYIRTASVIGPNQIEIKVFTDPSVNIDGYSLLRSNSAMGSYSQIAKIPFGNVANFTYNDFFVSTSEKSYYYKIQSIDSCGYPGLMSNKAHTILLKGLASNSYTNQLEWTDYGDWVGNVDNYTIYRSVNDVFNPAPIAIVPPLAVGSTYLYQDDIGSFITGNGKFEYFIKANEAINTTYNFIEESNSNIIEIVQKPEMYIPNAFSPEGVNKVFKPVMAFVNNENYFMQIYNRFGQLIFDNNNPEVGWDGKYLGEYVKQGVYVYLIRYSLPNHELVQRKGLVTVIF